jgi:hypothetical protein
MAAAPALADPDLVRLLFQYVSWDADQAEGAINYLNAGNHGRAADPAQQDELDASRKKLRERANYMLSFHQFLTDNFFHPNYEQEDITAPGGNQRKPQMTQQQYDELLAHFNKENEIFEQLYSDNAYLKIPRRYDNPAFAPFASYPPGGDIGNGKPKMRGGRLPTDPLIEASIEQKNRLAAIIRGFAQDRENDRVFRPNLSELSRIESDHGAAVRTFEESTDDANKVSDFERSDRDIYRRMWRVIDRVRNRKYELAAAFRDEMRRARPEYVSDDPSSKNDMMGGRLPVTEGDPPHSAPYNQTVFPGQVVPLPPRPDPGAVYLKNYTARMNAIKETMTPGGLDSKIVGVKPIHTSGDVFQHYFIHFVTK